MKKLVKILILICLMTLTGCTQRQIKYYEYDEKTQIHKEWVYKTNSLASKETIDWLYLELPNKGTLYLGPYELDNDSFGLEFDPLTKTVRIKTEDVP